MTIRLHNDDVNTFNFVIDSLQHILIPQSDAEVSTSLVDKDGHAYVKRGKGPELQSNFLYLINQKLLTSMVPDIQHYREERSSVIIAWFHDICRKVDGFARIVTDGLLDIIEFDEMKEYLGLGGEEFVWKNVHFEVRKEGEEGEEQWVLMTKERTLPLKRRTKLFYLLLCDFFLPKKFRIELHSFYLSMLVDQKFKTAVAQELTESYLFLNELYSRGIGTGEDTIFSISVQLYTTASLVRSLSVTEAPGEKDGLVSILVNAAYDALR